MKARRTKSKNIYIYLAVAVAIAVIAFSAIEQVVRTARPKVAAADYFESGGGIPTSWDEITSTDEVLYLFEVQFNFTAVGGDAHRIVIAVPGMTPTEQWPYIAELRQNETLVVTLPRFTMSYPVRKNADGYFVFMVSLDCDEATGKMTILLKEYLEG